MKPELQLFESNPIIAAVKDGAQLEKALSSDCDILFFSSAASAPYPAWWPGPRRRASWPSFIWT